MDYQNFDVVFDKNARALRSGVPEQLRSWLMSDEAPDLDTLRVFVSKSRTVMDAKYYVAVKTAQDITREVIWKSVREFLQEADDLGYYSFPDLDWFTDQIVNRIIGRSSDK